MDSAKIYILLENEVNELRYCSFLTFSEAHYVPGSNILNQIDLHIIVLDDVVLTFHHGPIQAIQLVVGMLL
jgi:Mg2+ and Co2+ transporter CorA